MKLALLLVQLPAALMILYLDLLSLAALRRRRPLPSVPPAQRFAVLIPAHDEEQLLPRLLGSLALLAYPGTLYDVHVVADNCTDRTAAVAAEAGATVHQRTDDDQRGKGYALRWLLARLKEGEQAPASYDAYVIIDADSVVSPNLLDVFNAHLARGDETMQAFYGVLNQDAAWTAMLRYVALALYNGLRPRGREALGLSAGLRGNGMCFAAGLIERFGWQAFTLAEDAEFHLTLVAAGVRVAYAADATVLAEMPTSLAQSRSQNIRWERGRLQMLREFGPRLLLDGLRQHDPVRLDAVAEQLVPPLSVLTGLTTLSVALTTAMRARSAQRLATATLLGQVGYVVAGLRLVGAGPRAYVALLAAPLYVLWKIGVYVWAAIDIRDTRWVRTQRRDPSS